MAVLYGLNTAAAEPMPNDNQAPLTWTGTAFTAARNASETNGSTTYVMTKALGIVTGPSANTDYWKGSVWLSPRYSAGTISSGTWTWEIYASVGKAALGSWVKYCSPAFYAYVWDGTTDTLKSVLASNYSNAIKVTTTITKYTITASGTSRTLANGDRIGIDVFWWSNTYAGAPMTVYTGKGAQRWGSSTYPSKMTIPGSLPAEYVPPNPSRMMTGIGA